MLGEGSTPQKTKGTAGMQFDVWHKREAQSSVVNAVDLPSGFAFVATKQNRVPQLEIPFVTQPRIFVPPISRANVGPILSRSRSMKFTALNMNGFVLFE